MRQIVTEMQSRRVFASIDLHNNTGRNPHYACVNRLAFPFLHLASFFSRTVKRETGRFVQPTLGSLACT